MPREELLDRFARLTLLVVGDVMLDRYVYGAVERISPEAPIPVLKVERETAMLGGAGNVARNVVDLGGRALLLSTVGEDQPGRELCSVAPARPELELFLLPSPTRTTSLKTRFVAGGQQLLRVDEERAVPLSPEEAAALLATAAGLLDRVDAVLVSDYAKGVLPPVVVGPLIASARAAGKAVVVDPKSRDLRRYAGATVLKPNTRELADATGLPVDDDGAVERAARHVLDEIDVGAVLVTRSERGASVVPRGQDAVHLPSSQYREVYDVSGAGDTALAAFGLCLAAGASLADAADIANRAAGIAVGKRGTASVLEAELRRALRHDHLAASELKIVSIPEAAELASRWRAEGLRVGFTNGCFDLLHPGHAALLAFARAHCDRLVVGLNSDVSVRRLKGPTRPVNPEAARAIVLASLADVDAVVIFDDDTPLELIRLVRPAVLIKGADYRLDQVVGGDEVERSGGKVLLAPLMPGYSTTRMVARMSAPAA